MGEKLKFIDLFAGLGGFHNALHSLGMECVFACELENHLRELYEKNYGIKPEGDIRKVKEKDIPEHDILCAGFPCQPFSIAGMQKGAKCPTSGKLIDDVIRIAKHHTPEMIFLENVPNIKTIDNGSFWNYLNESFSKIGYYLEDKIYSPVDFNIPQKRKRIFIIAKKQNNTAKIKWPEVSSENSSDHILKYFNNFELSNENEKKLEDRKEKILNTWQSIISNIPSLTGHYIVSSEFGANYPIEFSKLTLNEMKRYKGAWGVPLSKCKTWNEIFELLPHYIDRKMKKPVKWISTSLASSREIYNSSPNTFNPFIKELKASPQSWQKLQWQSDRSLSKKNLWEHLIQFRASGIRIIRANSAPSLISMTTTQIPILGLEKRYLNSKEAACLQGLHNLKELPRARSTAFKALGNAVNSTVIQMIAENTIPEIMPTLKASGY
ncbi:MAG: DNA cytosine methyltransferase [Halarcobacter sp.]